MKYLALPQERGSLAIPNITLYYWAALLHEMSTLFTVDKDIGTEQGSNIPTIY